MERTGTFSCSHDLLNKFHQNVVWAMRGNFVDVPTDCPQRDERLGWTGDAQVFAPSASFLYNVDGFFADWLEDLIAVQSADGKVPIVIPNEPLDGPQQIPYATGWSDCAATIPWTLYERFGDVDRLARQFDSMKRWVDFLVQRTSPSLIWNNNFQFGDWLDPDAPPEQAWKAKTDPTLVATAYFAKSAQIVSDTAGVLGLDEFAADYAHIAQRVRTAFRNEYMTPNGRLTSDAATAYSLAIMLICLKMTTNAFTVVNV